VSGPVFGAIADDFTGATDLADQLVAVGMRTVQLIGSAAQTIPPDVDAVVIALKTRTIAAGAAVTQSLAALDLLERSDVKQVLFKYCSTFDSTARGNIGPVGDALAERLAQDVTVFCPAYPANKRSIFKGYLFAGDVLLSESSMRDHPLTPMRDANLVRVLGAQSRRRVTLVGLQTVRRGGAAIAEALARQADDGPAHVIVDVTEDADLYALGEALDGVRLITGGAGIALGLPANYRRRGWLDVHDDPVAAPVRGGRAAVIAGSASEATRAQVADFRSAGAPVFTIEAEQIADPPAAIAAALAWCGGHPDTAVLVSATAEPAGVRANQERFGIEGAGERVETILAGVAAGLVAAGVRRLVVAGGETSGAVAGALGVTRLRIGPRIDIGVPWTIVESSPRLGLALKSGNFGGPDFFRRALAMTA
jgi:3-dehydrotetronate 4-kinase